MRRAPAWIVAVGVLVGWAASPPTAQAGVWVTLAAGLPGSSTPLNESEFWFDTPHGPPAVAVNQLNGGVMATAATAGGSVNFGGLGTPVLLNLADGSAYVAGGTPPSGATNRGPIGGGAVPPASAAPTAGGSVPSNAALLGVNLADPAADGSRSLTATATDANGSWLGTAHVSLPNNGWWVLGLTPGAGPGAPPITGGNDGGSGGNNGGTNPDPGTNPGTGGGTNPDPGTNPGTGGETPPPSEHGHPVSTPEPGTLLLAGIGGLGGLALRSWRRFRAVATV